MRARLTMHSRSTDSVTRRNSGSVSAPGAGAPGGMMRRTSASSRPSSTPISVAAMRDQRVLLGAPCGA